MVYKRLKCIGTFPLCVQYVNNIMKMKWKYLKIDIIIESNSEKMNVVVKWLRTHVFIIFY